MAFADILLAGSATRDHAAAIATGATRLVGLYAGGAAGAVRAAIIRTNFAKRRTGGLMLAHRPAGLSSRPPQEGASADGKR